MTVRHLLSSLRRLRRTLLSVGAISALAFGTVTTAIAPVQAATVQQPKAASASASLSSGTPAHSLPCDTYRAAGTPCVAAHSMVRALYRAYDGPLYQV